MKKIILSLALLAVSMTITAQNEVLTNSSITDMLELGFANDVIVTKINTSETNFDTSIQALKALKDNGVSNDIIVTMMNAGKQDKIAKTSEKKNRSGIYFKSGEEYKKIFPTVFSGTKTSTLGAAFTYGIADAKIKSTMNNAHSNNIIKTNIPEFYFYFDDKERTSFAAGASNWWFTVASSPNEFVLTKLKSKKGRRELETGKVNLYAGNSIGIDEDNMVNFDIEVLNEWEFKVTPEVPLLPGEYCFFYQGTVPQGGFNNQSVFDFSIPESCKIEHKYKVGDYVWVLEGGKAKELEVTSIYAKKDGIHYFLRNRNSWKEREYNESDCFSSKEEITDLM